LLKFKFYINTRFARDAKDAEYIVSLRSLRLRGNNIYTYYHPE